MRAIISLLSLLLVSACATTPTSCPLVMLARMPFYSAGDLMFVAGGIAGHPVRLLVDTGAERTVLTTSAVERLGLPHDLQHVSRTIGISGISTERDAFVPGLDLGGRHFPIDRVAVGDFSFHHMLRQQLDGLLGADILLAYDLDIDPATHQLTLYRVRRCPDSLPPWNVPATEIAGVSARRDRMLVPITLNGRHRMAILDTGAQLSAVGMGFARSLGLPADELQADRLIFLYGASPGAIGVRLHVFHQLQMGPVVADDAELAIVPRTAGVGDALIGEDFLRGRRIWFSFPTGHLFVSR